MIHLFLAALGAAAVLFVLYPVFLRQREVLPRVSDAAIEKRRLTEKKERLLASLHDLDFEHSAGKLSETDYAQVRAEFVAQAAQVMHELEAVAPKDGAAAPAEPVVAEASSTPSAPELRPFCIQCGQQNPSDASFCFRCGTRIEILHA